MYKKLIALVFSVAVVASVNAKNVSVVSADQAAVNTAASELLVEKLSKTLEEKNGVLTEKDVKKATVEAASELVYATVALRKNEKLVWAAIGGTVVAAIATALWLWKSASDAKKEKAKADKDKVAVAATATAATATAATATAATATAPATAPVATAPVATAPAATAPVATAPVATAPVATAAAPAPAATVAAPAPADAAAAPKAKKRRTTRKKTQE